MVLSKNELHRELGLLETCRRTQGERLLPGSGSGSWATTYSDDFIAAAAELFSLYQSKSHGASYPIARLSQRFEDFGIKSCRGAVMSISRVEYLYKTHLMSVIRL